MPDYGNLEPGVPVRRIMGPDGAPNHAVGRRGVAAMFVSRELGPGAPIPYVVILMNDGRRVLSPCHQLVVIELAANEEGRTDA